MRPLPMTAEGSMPRSAREVNPTHACNAQPSRSHEDMESTGTTAPDRDRKPEFTEEPDGVHRRRNTCKSKVTPSCA